MDFDAIIGLELHIQLKTKSKMFSSAPVSFGLEPNTVADSFDIGFPGTMPTVNKQAVVSVIQVANALNMIIDKVLQFERKNYFYSDLPKGYQLTQQFRPIGRNGLLSIKTSNGVKSIGIERVHLEEDTCKQIHYNDYTLLDFNRAGIPLIEIVTKPEIRNGEEALQLVKKIRSIVTFLGVSDGKMENGSLRCDVNVSLKKKDSDVYGTKVEIKNLNSLNNIQKAIDYEIDRQRSLLESNKSIKQETRRFDENTNKTVIMRNKKDEIDYRYFTDTNIPSIVLSDEFVNDAITSSKELPEHKFERYKSLGLTESECSLVLNDSDLSNFLDQLISFGANPRISINWLNVEIQGYLKKKNISISEFEISPRGLSELIKLIQNNKLTNNQAKRVFDKMLKEPNRVKEIIEENKDNQPLDIGNIKKCILEVLSSNTKSVLDYNNGKDKALDFIVGQVMRKVNGIVDVIKVKELIIKEIKGDK